MVVITASAVVLAARLDARLLAALAWIGGYMTPVLLSTGDDRVWALYGFLLLLDVGALVIDHRKPWPETVPMAMVGTVMLWGAWYARFFRPERFEAAAFGIVLFTALFAFGMARKERGGLFLSMAYMLGGMGVGLLAAGADRPEALLILSIGLAGTALRLVAGRGRGLSLVAAAAAGPALHHVVGVALPSRVLRHRRGLDIAGGVLALVAAAAGGRGPVTVPLEPLALIGGGVASIALAAATDRPALLTPFLLALAAVAALARRRWAWSEVAGVTTAAVAVLSWFDRFYKPDRAPEALTLALTVAGAYLLALVTRGFVMRQSDRGRGRRRPPGGRLPGLDRPLQRARSVRSRRALGLASLALAALYLAIGLAALRGRREDQAQAEGARGPLASPPAFLTLAIPVQLGLHGITLAWALEGVLLLGLGARIRSRLARLGGYGVLGLAVLRLFARHLPLHDGAFRPFLNPAFGTWLAVIVLLALGARLARAARADEGSLDRALRALSAMATVVLLFGLLTAETQATFAQRASLARAAGRRGGGRGGGARGRPGRLRPVDGLRHRPAGGGARAAQPRPLLFRLRALRRHVGQGGPLGPGHAGDALPDAVVPRPGRAAAGGRVPQPALPAAARSGIRRAVSRRGAARTLAAAVLGLAAAAADRPTVERAIAVPRPGRVAVVLDRDVYESARADLGDLRIVDGEDRPVPYLLERVGEEAPEVKTPILLNRGFARGKSATVTLDFEGPVLKRELTLSLSGDNFRRRVVVEGKGRHDDAWTTITDSAYVFAVPPSTAAPALAAGDARRYETVTLPENNHPFLKVTVFRGQEETGDLEIRDVRAGTVPSAARARSPSRRA